MQARFMAALALAFVGCAVDDDDEQLGETSSTITIHEGTSAGGQQQGKRRGRRILLPVGPPGGGGGGIDPANYGMCGFVHLAGYFDFNAIAEIVVDASGYYALDIYEGLAFRPQDAVSPYARVECIKLAEFTGLPPNHTAIASYSTVSDGTGFHQWVSTPLPSACPWAGLRGHLSATVPPTTPLGDWPVLFANALWDTGFLGSVIAQGHPSAGEITSSAFCTNYVSPHAWGYDHTTFDLSERYAGIGWIPQRRSDAWCYLEGVARTADFSPFAAVITLGTPPGSTDLHYQYHTVGSTALYWNCLPLNQ